MFWSIPYKWWLMVTCEVANDFVTTRGPSVSEKMWFTQNVWCLNNWLVVDLPLWKICSSVGIMKFPIYGKIIQMFQTTNQITFYLGIFWVFRGSKRISMSLANLILSAQSSKVAFQKRADCVHWNIRNFKIEWCLYCFLSFFHQKTNPLRIHLGPPNPSKIG